MIRVFFAFTVSLFSVAALADARAIDVTLYGAGAFFDNAGYKVISLVAGDLVARGEVRKFFVHRPEPATQSAKAFCLELKDEPAAVTALAALQKVTPTGRLRLQTLPSCE